jgi:anti-sigma regulatory factor (Ser/Thr protein kinase)
VPCDLSAVDGARARIIAAAAGWGFSPVGDLEVIASELLTNAIVHGHSASVATCRMLAPGHLELAINDHGPGLPHMRKADDRSLSGRGLRIVDALSTTWGVEDVPDDGKTVWARLGAPS